MSEQQVEAIYENLSYEQTLEILNTCPTRYIDNKYHPPSKKLQIFYRDEWVGISRIDLCKQVCTGSIYPTATIEDSIAKCKSWYERVIKGCGDRFENVSSYLITWPDGRKNLAIIDSMTDG